MDVGKNKNRRWERTRIDDEKKTGVNVNNNRPEEKMKRSGRKNRDGEEPEETEKKKWK